MERLAEMIMFGGIKTKAELEKYIEGKFEFKNGKGIKDINDAMRKALTGKSSGKTEWELQAFADGLIKVFKKL